MAESLIARLLVLIMEFGAENVTQWDDFVQTFSSYFFSRYAIMCMFISLLINRTVVVASQSRLVSFLAPPKANVIKLSVSVLLRSIAIAFLLDNVNTCIWYLHHLAEDSNTVLARVTNYTIGWLPDRVVSLIQTDVSALNSSIYWRMYMTYCFSAFIEAFVATIHSQKIKLDSSLTLFEMSMLMHLLDRRDTIFTLNKYPDVGEPGLVIALFYSILHLNFQIGDLVNGNKYRLVVLALSNIGFIGYIMGVSLWGDNFDNVPLSVFQIVLPEVLLLIVVGLSAIVFALGVICSGFDVRLLNFSKIIFPDDPDENRTVQVSVSWSDDFMGALLNLALLAVTLAGKSNYISELSLIVARTDTWVEESLWKSLKWQVQTLRASNPNLSTDKLMKYLRANGISGYANLITHPSPRLLSGSQAAENKSGYPADLFEGQRVSIIRRRWAYCWRVVGDFTELIKAILSRWFMATGVWLKSKILRQAATLPPAPVPQFLREFIVKRTTTPDTKPGISLHQLSMADVASSYSLLLKGPDIADEDDDEWVGYESESDFSEVEDLTGVPQRGPEPPLAFHELVTADSVRDFLEQSQDPILHHHLVSDGIVTRSRYSTITNAKREQEAHKLVELILHKRGAELQRLYEDKPVPKLNLDDEEYGSGLTCVICQVNPREIVTWPCRCFAICETCRVSLVHKQMEGCVTCRKDVEGVSKVFLP